MLGSGTANDPYQIVTRADLEAIVNDYTAHYKLMNDIDLSDGDWTPLPLRHPVTNALFSGTIDGNGKKIKNMKVAITSGNIRASFIEGINGATIVKLGFENLDLSTNYMYASPLAYANNSLIEQCWATGKLTLNGTATYGGGICGYATNGTTINDCWSNVDITTNSGKICGGFVGYAYQNTTTINRCLSFGTVSGDGKNLAGGFYGQLPTNLNYLPRFSACMFDRDRWGSTNFTTANVSARNTSYLQTASNFNAFSDDIWTKVDGSYPSLKAFEEQVVVIIEDRNVLSYVDNINSDIMLNKLATVKRVSSIKEFSADTQKIIKAVKVGTTFVKDIVSGVSREVQIVKVGSETVTSYILPITSNIEILKRRVQILDETVTSYIRPITSDVERQIKSLRQSLSFIDVIVGRVITPNLTPKQIKAIVSHMENGTLAHYLNSQYNVSILNDLSVLNTMNNNSSVNTLENQTLSEVRE